MARKDPHDTRTRILDAAEHLSCENGPAHVSIEAVAARAGVSKGGFLYHFPTKQALLRALVSEHVEGLRRAMAARGGDTPLAQALAYLDVMRDKLTESGPRPGLFAAIAEDPEFIAPVRALRAEILDDVFRRCPDPKLATVVFLASEGLVFARLTDPLAHDGAELAGIFEMLGRLLDAPTPGPKAELRAGAGNPFRILTGARPWFTPCFTSLERDKATNSAPPSGFGVGSWPYAVARPGPQARGRRFGVDAAATRLWRRRAPWLRVARLRRRPPAAAPTTTVDRKTGGG